jgi:hypothetical protein
MPVEWSAQRPRCDDAPPRRSPVRYPIAVNAVISSSGFSSSACLTCAPSASAFCTDQTTQLTSRTADADQGSDGGRSEGGCDVTFRRTWRCPTRHGLKFVVQLVHPRDRGTARVGVQGGRELTLIWTSHLDEEDTRDQHLLVVDRSEVVQSWDRSARLSHAAVCWLRTDLHSI